MASNVQGFAYVKDRYLPLEDATIPVIDWGYRRSDVTYDVVTVWKGAFFQLDAHLARFRRSMKSLRLKPRESDDEIRTCLIECVRRSQLRDAYVAVDCLRGTPAAEKLSHPANADNYIIAFARPYVSIMSEDVQKRGTHLIVASAQRIASESVDPTVKNFHWGDLTQGAFEALDAGADGCVLLDRDKNVTEGPGYNVFSVVAGKVVTPNRGALEGITRMSVIELCADERIQCEVRPLPVSEFLQSDEIFITSSAGGIMPVSRINKTILCNDRPGPVSSHLRQRYWERREQGWHATPVDYDSVESS
jgi:branched-chain amino acid aminotransferase